MGKISKRRFIQQQKVLKILDVKLIKVKNICKIFPVSAGQRSNRVHHRFLRFLLFLAGFFPAVLLVVVLPIFLILVVVIPVVFAEFCALYAEVQPNLDAAIRLKEIVRKRLHVLKNKLFH